VVSSEAIAICNLLADLPYAAFHEYYYCSYLALIATPAVVLPAEQPDVAQQASGDRVGPIKLRAVPVDQILELLERWTGKSLLRPQNLPAVTVSLDLKEEVTKAKGIRAIETLLSLNGIGVSDLDESFLKVDPLGDDQERGPRTHRGVDVGLASQWEDCEQTLPTEVLRVNDFVPQISGLLESWRAGGGPAIFEKANAVLVTDSLTNLQRIETLLTHR